MLRSRSRKFWRGRDRKFWKVGVGSRKLWKGRSRIFYLRLRNPSYKKRIKKKEQYILYLMINLPLTKRSQQYKTVRRCRTPMKSNIASFGCYVWLLPNTLPASRDYLLKLYMLITSVRTVPRVFCFEKRVHIGLTSHD